MRANNTPRYCFRVRQVPGLEPFVPLVRQNEGFDEREKPTPDSQAAVQGRRGPEFRLPWRLGGREFRTGGRLKGKREEVSRNRRAMESWFVPNGGVEPMAEPSGDRVHQGGAGARMPPGALSRSHCAVFQRKHPCHGRTGGEATDGRRRRWAARVLVSTPAEDSPKPPVQNSPPPNAFRSRFTGPRAERRPALPGGGQDARTPVPSGPCLRDAVQIKTNRFCFISPRCSGASERP